MAGRRAARVGAVAGILVVLGLLMDSRVDTSTDPPEATAPDRTESVRPAPTEASTPIPTPTVAEVDAGSSSTSTAPLRSATISFSGDVLLHSRVWRMAAANAGAEDRDGFDFTSMFGPVREVIAEADWSVCHLEVTLDGENRNLSSYPRFRGPGAIAADLHAVGFDACSTASNHSLDWGTQATFETIDVLEAAGIRAVGTARSPEEARSSMWFDIGGIRVAHLGYAYWFNGFRLPADQPWAANQIDEQRILDDAAAARSGGADLVILSLHWGDQYQHRPSGQQADLGPRLLASDDIDLIVGHHAHVVQPVERIDGEWLVYGVGNLLSNQTQLARRDELIVLTTVKEQEDGSFVVDRVQALPVFLDIDTLTMWPSGPGLRTEAVPERLTSSLDASWERVVNVLETGSGWDHLELIGS